MTERTTTQHWGLAFGMVLSLVSLLLLWNAECSVADEVRAPDAVSAATKQWKNKPAAPKEKPKAPVPVTPVFSLAPGSVSLTVSLVVPQNCKVNEEAPNAIKVSAKDKASGKEVALEVLSSLAIPADAKKKTSFEQKLSLSLQKGQTVETSVSADFYTCDMSGKVCYPPIAVKKTAELKGDAGTTASAATIRIPTALKK